VAAPESELAVAEMITLLAAEEKKPQRVDIAAHSKSSEAEAVFPFEEQTPPTPLLNGVA